MASNLTAVGVSQSSSSFPCEPARRDGTNNHWYALYEPRSARGAAARSDNDYKIVPGSDKARKNTWYELIEDGPHCFASRHERADSVEAAAPAPADFCIVRSKYA